MNTKKEKEEPSQVPPFPFITLCLFLKCYPDVSYVLIPIIETFKIKAIR